MLDVAKREYLQLRKRGFDAETWNEFIHYQFHTRVNDLHQLGFRDFGRWRIRVLVVKKVPERLVEPQVLVSNVMKETGFDFPTDVVEVGEVSLATNNSVYRPVTCGVSGGSLPLKQGALWDVSLRARGMGDP